jgi:hypothetical protein
MSVILDSVFIMSLSNSDNYKIKEKDDFQSIYSLIEKYVDTALSVFDTCL